MKDINRFSFIGPDDDGRAVDLGDIDLSSEVSWASAIKCTQGVDSLAITAGLVPGGHDACLDVNNKARNLRVTIDKAAPYGQFAATLKDGARNVTVTIKRLLQHGSVCDLITDDYADQGHEATSGIVYDVTPADGKPVTVIALKTKPSFAAGSGPYVFLFPWPWINPAWLGHPWGLAFEVVRRWGFFRKDANT